MREMVLNQATLVAADPHTVSNQLLEMTRGIVTLITRGVTGNSLRMSQHLHEVSCADGVTLSDAIHALQKQGARDEFQYMIRLITKAPLLDAVDEYIADRFLRCEVTGFNALDLSQDDGMPLLYCAVTDGIAVGFPSAPIWDRDQVDVTFDELLPNDEFESRMESVDNLTRVEHASAIVERHIESVRDVPTTSELWARRASAFPNLIFGPDIEGQLNDVNMSDLSAIVKKLSLIDDCAGGWQTSSSRMPAWGVKVTRESDRVRNNRALMDKRRFRSHNGNREVFEWHARFGRANRIHLRFDAQTKEVEIGYIGKHLPL